MSMQDGIVAWSNVLLNVVAISLGKSKTYDGFNKMVHQLILPKITYLFHSISYHDFN